MAGRVNMTERFAKAARADGRKSPIFYDDEVMGVGLEVRDSRRKTFTLDHPSWGWRQRYLVGDQPGMDSRRRADEEKLRRRILARVG